MIRALKQLIAWCKKGPDGALVNNVQIQEKFQAKEAFVNFKIG